MTLFRRHCLREVGATVAEGNADDDDVDVLYKRPWSDGVSRTRGPAVGGFRGREAD